jgi:aspartyl-tRNA(Asn)/glutamyl-tRNA(Gln) amidotransferase subunit A
VNLPSSISEAIEKISSGSYTLKDLVSEYLKRIDQNADLNAFREVFNESALNAAQEIDKKIRDGKAGKLAGLVIGLKDNICYKGHKVSASSKILDGFVSIYNSTVVERLLAEDAVIIGRLNCDEFAMGSSNENSAFGPVKNPLDKNRVTGGSSGGSVAAVAGDLCLATLGSDTGGSIRQPASFTGTVGLKPTYGRVSRYGLIAYASSFDQIGPITKNISDASRILEVIAGIDEHDSTLSRKPVPKYLSEKNDGKKNIAIIRECIDNDGLNPEIRSYIKGLIDQLKSDGHTINEVSFPYLEYLVPTYYVLTTAEASSNLSRFDGVHYGYRSPQAYDLDSSYRKSRTEGFGKEVKRRIMLGTFVLSAGYYDAYYAKAQKVRRLIKNRTNEILAENDFILLPSTPDVAFEFGKNSADPVKMYLEDIFTVQANLAGNPAISLPLAKADGLPFGIQLIGKDFAEDELLSFSDKLMNKPALITTP